MPWRSRRRRSGTPRWRSRPSTHGKHVFVEKPLALDVADGERVAAVAGAANRTVMVGHLLQYHPAFLKLGELVRAGEVGRIQYLYSSRLNLGRIRREENVFWSFAPHDLSMILALAGEPPTKVSAVGCSYLHPSIADVTTTHLEFANGIRGAHLRLVAAPVQGAEAGRGRRRRHGGVRRRPALGAQAHLVPPPDRLAQRAAGAGPGGGGAGRARAGRAAATGMPALPRLRPHRCAAAHRRRRGPCGAPRPARPRRRRCARPDRPAPVSTAATAGVFVHESAFVDHGCELGEGTRIWHFSHLLGGVRIGRDCVIGQNVMIGPDVAVGDRCKIQNNVSLYRGVTLEDGVFCGPSCVFTNVLNPRAEIERKDEFRATLVRRGATIGANATIVCGRTLGEYCFVAAGAVVTRDVPAFALVAGNPARRIGWVSRSGERLGPDLICPRTGERYHEIEPDRLVAEA